MPPQKQVSNKRRTKSASQKRHQHRASAAMKLWKNGKAASLKAAWKKV